MKALPSIMLFGVSLWLAWPMLTLRTYPHIGLREYAALVGAILANVILPGKVAP